MNERERLIGRIEHRERELIRLIARDQRTGLFSVNLTMQQIRVLMLLDIETSLPVHELAARLGVGLATTTGIVDRLVAHGLVSRRTDPDDRRIRRVEPTPAGRRTCAEISDAGRDRKRRVLRRLAPDVLHDLARVMDAMGDAIRAENAEHGDSGRPG